MKQVHQETLVRSSGHSSKFESRFDPSAAAAAASATRHHHVSDNHSHYPGPPPPAPQPHTMTLPRAKPERKIKEDFCTGCSNRDNHYADISNR